MSALACGCDPECQHLCQEHRHEGLVYRIVPALRCGCTEDDFCLKHRTAFVTSAKRDELLQLFACQALQTLPRDLDLVDRLVAEREPKSCDFTADGYVVPGSVVAKRLGLAAALLDFLQPTVLRSRV